MKKSWILIFSLLLFLALALSACTASAPSDEIEEKMAAEPEKEQLSLALETMGFSMDFNEKDVRLAELRLTYPKLVVVTESGEEYIGPETETVEGVTRYLDEVRIAKNFNAMMETEMAVRKEEFSTMCSDAQSHYNSIDEENRQYWGNYALEINCTSFQSDALISTVGLGYWYAGGAHPSSFHETWNFDLTTGEFFTIDDFDEDGACRRAVADEVARQIYAQQLNLGYFEDYKSIVFDLAYTHLSFDDTGLTIRFDLYTLAPYAMGVPEFLVGYDVFCEYLNEHYRTVLPVPQEAYVLSNFHTAQELWSYFHMSTIPLDYDVPAIEQDGMIYRRVKYEDITTVEELKAHLCLYVTEETAEEWLNRTPDRFREFDGVLYCFEADRGSDPGYGNPRYEVALLINHGAVTETLDEYDTTKWDDATGEFPVIGQKVIQYPFTLVDGRAIFEHFNCVW